MLYGQSLLGDEDLELQESANLTEICTEIATILSKVQAEGQAAADEAYDEGMEPDEFQAMLRSHCVADDGLVPLIRLLRQSTIIRSDR